MQAHEGQVMMANGSTAGIPGTMTMSVGIGYRRYTHKFAILPSLESAVLIGTDLWGRTGIAIPSPKLPRRSAAAPICGTTGGLQPRTAEEVRL